MADLGEAGLGLLQATKGSKSTPCVSHPPWTSDFLGDDLMRWQKYSVGKSTQGLALNELTLVCPHSTGQSKPCGQACHQPGSPSTSRGRSCRVRPGSEGRGSKHAICPPVPIWLPGQGRPGDCSLIFFLALTAYRVPSPRKYQGIFMTESSPESWEC